ncbi:MAG: multicopper oxidase family protein, partial [Gemmatimonadaceae bacterium]
MNRGAWMAALFVAALAGPGRAQQHDTTTPPNTPMPGMQMPADTTGKRTPPAQMPMSMPGRSGNTMAMPIPMPKGMVMMPGLVGLTPPGGTFLPGAGVDPSTLPAVRPSAVVQMKNGDTLDLSATLVRRTVAGRPYVMYGFNGEVPGPLIRVPQNATITVRFHNRIDLPSSVHWHGVRLDNRFDGAVGITQQAVAPGDSFVYHVHFPDAGVYWYHPHVREDVEQALGLFGNMIVDAPDSAYYSPANREQVLVFDDLLVNADSLIPYGKTGPDFALMGRVGNLLLVNGEPHYTFSAHRGEVIRFFLTNAASSRTYNISFGGAPMKVLASDVSRFEHEERVPSVVLAPAERYIVEVRFDTPGRYALVNAVQAINHFRGEFDTEVDTLGIVTVDSTPAAPDYARPFDALRDNAAVSQDIARYRPYFDKPPDKRLTLTMRGSGLPIATVQFMNVDT